MVVKKTIKMTQKMKIPILGMIENMSYAVCPHCNEKLEIFGKSQGEKVAAETKIDFLGSLPWDSRLNSMLDAGQIEDYESKEMSSIADKLLSKMASGEN